jgi:hypothetical protein
MFNLSWPGEEKSVPFLKFSYISPGADVIMYIVQMGPRPNFETVPHVYMLKIIFATTRGEIQRS